MRYLFIFFVFGLTACIDPISLKQEGGESVLVIEGGITTEYGPHIINLSRTAEYGDIFVGIIENELGAKLFIRDELGNTITLLELGKGVYATPSNFKGEVGTTYTLIILTKDGTEYQSYPEIIKEVPKIESISVDYVDVPIVKEELGGTIVSGVNVYVNFSDPVGINNYYKWNTGGSYSLRTHPELFTPPNSRVPVPKNCCELCYASESNIGISISSDRFYDGNTYDGKIVFIEDDGVRFSEKYIIDIEQLSLSKEAYEFFDLLNNQLSIKGNIFDPPPAIIRGNIIGISNPDENVVGYFTASDIKRKEFHIYKDDLPRVVPLPIIPDDCREVRKGTITPPNNW